MKFRGLFVCLLSGVLSVAASGASAEATRSVAAVNAPLAHIARVLGGPDIEVIYPLPSGVDPAFWKPSPEAVQRFQDADLILLNGAGYAGWVETAILPRARLVDTTAAVQDRLIPGGETGVAHKHGPQGEHAHAGRYAFTTWLDPDIAQAQVDAAAEAITRRWPELADEVAARAPVLRAEIAAMDEAFTTLSRRLAGRQVFASHPVYQYFNRAYLGQLISLHWEPDAVPSEEEWSAFSAMFNPGQSPMVIWEDTPMQQTSDRLAKLGVDHVVVSPMANDAETERLFHDIAEQVR